MVSINGSEFSRDRGAFRSALSHFLMSAAFRAFLLAVSLLAVSLPLRAQTELGAEDDLTVLGTNGTALDPDVEVKGFTVFGSTQAAYTGAVVGPGGVVVNGALAVSSGAYFTGVSTFSSGMYVMSAASFTDVANIYITGGADNQVLAKNGANGPLKWTSTSALGDNLGSHTATQALDMAGNQIFRVSSMTILAPTTLASSLWVSSSAVTPHLYVSTSGNVGLGTAAPGAKLELGSGQLFVPAGSAAAPSYSFTGGSNVGIYKSGANEISFAISGTQIFKMDGNGNLVGVGGAALVSGTNRGFNITGQAGSAAAPIYSFVGDADNGIFSTAADNLNFATQGTERVRVDPAGNVGLSTGAPQARLDLVSAGSAPTDMAQIWRKGDGTVVSSMSATGVMMATKFIGDGTGLTGVGSSAGAANLLGGLANEIPYQTALNTTAFTAQPGANVVLFANNGAPGWTNAPVLTGTNITSIPGGSVTGSITGGAGLLNYRDLRTIKPSDDASATMRFGFTSFANNNTLPYADYLHLRSYIDASGGNDNLVMFRKDTIGMRIWQQTFGSATAYASYKDVAFTDGTNATGSWPISITGTSAGAAPSGAAGGNLSGTYPNPSIASLPAISGAALISLTGANVTGTVASSTNSDKLDGFHASDLQFYQSDRDFPAGTLIQSNIDYSVTSGEPFLLELVGNSYGSAIPFDIKVQGYIYSDTIINSGGISNGTNLTGLVAFNYLGKLCFWFPNQSYWQGFNVNINDSYGGIKKNRLVSVTNAAKPGGVTKEVAFTVRQSLHDGNFNSYAPTLTGTGASGSWPISITGTSAGAAPSGAAGGNLSGTYPNPSIASLPAISGAALTSLTGANVTGTVANATTAANLTNFSVLSGVNPDTKGTTGVQYFNGGGTSPYSDGALYQQAWQPNPTTWGSQIMQDYRTGRIAVRGLNNGTWTAWLTNIDSGNFNSYAPTLTGTGASGTWPISISGTSAGAAPSGAAGGNLSGTYPNPSIASLPAISGAALTSLTAANISAGTAGISVTGNAATATKLNSQGNYDNAAPGTTRGPAGLNLFQVYTNGYPTTYGNVLHMSGAGGGQLLLGWSGTDGANADNYIRSKRDNDTGAWSPWAKILTDVNYNTYAPTLTGTGASGTWPISITGTAAGVSGNATGISVADIRSTNPTPNAIIGDRMVSAQFNDQWGGGWRSALTVGGWTDGYAVWQLMGGSTTGTEESWFLRSGLNAAWNAWREVIHSGNIGSQSVAYATNSSKLYSTDAAYAYGSGAPYYGYLTYIPGNSRWRLNVSPATPAAVEVAYADTAGSAGSVAYASITGIPTRTAWNGVHRNFVAEQLSWKNYGNNHTVFDASAGTSPDGGVVNNTNAAIAWSANYPTLMGWNGVSTYGVRVDSARVADSVGGSAGGALTGTYPSPGLNNNVSYPVTAGDGNGLKFWNGADSYKISMGNAAEFHYGPVTDYSIKTNMESTAGRGFVWGIAGSVPTAGLGTNGNFQIAGSFTNDGNRVQYVTHGVNSVQFMPSARNSGGAGDIGLYTWISEPGQTWTGGGIARNMYNSTGWPRVNTGLGGQMINFNEGNQIVFIIEQANGVRNTAAVMGTTVANSTFYGTAMQAYYAP